MPRRTRLIVANELLPRPVTIPSDSGKTDEKMVGKWQTHGCNFGIAVTFFVVLHIERCVDDVKFGRDAWKNFHKRLRS